MLQGTRKINRPRIGAVCKRMGVDYAPAMAGFDIRAGRSVPRMEGVVVCEEVADAVLEEWQREQRSVMTGTQEISTCHFPLPMVVPYCRGRLWRLRALRS